MPVCPVCDKRMRLYAQLYCPLEGSPYHRTFHCFCCSSKQCWTESSGWGWWCGMCSKGRGRVCRCTVCVAVYTFMYTCVCVHVHVFIHTFPCVCVCRREEHTDLYTCAYTPTTVHECVYVLCVHVRTSVYTHISMCVCVCVCVCRREGHTDVCTCICILRHMCIHTHNCTWMCVCCVSIWLLCTCVGISVGTHKLLCVSMYIQMYTRHCVFVCSCIHMYAYAMCV